MPALQSGREQAFYKWYFLLHIVITVLVDATVVVPARWQLVPALAQWHIRQNDDFLLRERPLWMQAFVLVELVFQLPLFFYFPGRLHRLGPRKNKTQTDNSLLRGLLKVYGYNAALTSLCCCAAVVLRCAAGGVSTATALTLLALYLPYVVIPARLVFV
ncbi:Ema19p KNAG_0L00370 [Huiozyma naganishii CBS 8797]|uniref:Efficient mitochondria targeting-associated protein 19 n=1 Tax=Huiozyma naganishii (strain ATCC MYA-139 / BCRC 22969 / CBS 8797 / KCTC 17520 / NBRC 10181 / NCYC 3082 / Yp74L-3) TaxID=1071383 RepID=J7RCR2_HUIN7|nr:hypothetical protein KNAG_0L00370 [Kazachstania naganishii CBS 8797]CCK72660.1 hypothetical protein KNAG_0L00370 [Kazachstania naganishii CBS 8797]